MEASPSSRTTSHQKDENLPKEDKSTCVNRNKHNGNIFTRSFTETR